MKAWNCEITSSAKHSLTDKIFQPASTQVDVDAFTVGQKIDLQCRGEMLSQSTTDWKITLKTEKEEHILKVPIIF